MRVIILADTANTAPHTIPRQLYEINGEVLIERTIRQIKENKKKSIYITSHDKRFEFAGTKRYEHDNSWDGKKDNGIWLDAFPLDLIVNDTVILMGDVWYTDEAMKTILSYKGNDNHYFCTNIEQERSPYHFKPYDEPLAWYIGDAEAFKTAVTELKKLQKDAETVFINWHLFRYINGMDIDTHAFPESGYTAINDGSIDIDGIEDKERLERSRELYKVRCIKGYYDRSQKKQIMPKAEFIVPYFRMLELLGNNSAKTVVCEMVEEVNG